MSFYVKLLNVRNPTKRLSLDDEANFIPTNFEEELSSNFLSKNEGRIQIADTFQSDTINRQSSSLSINVLDPEALIDLIKVANANGWYMYDCLIQEMISPKFLEHHEIICLQDYIDVHIRYWDGNDEGYYEYRHSPFFPCMMFDYESEGEDIFSIDIDGLFAIEFDFLLCQYAPFCKKNDWEKLVRHILSTDLPEIKFKESDFDPAVAAMTVNTRSKDIQLKIAQRIVFWTKDRERFKQLCSEVYKYK